MYIHTLKNKVSRYSNENFFTATQKVRGCGCGGFSTWPALKGGLLFGVQGLNGSFPKQGDSNIDGKIL